jgi:hypothetical protein
MQTDHESRRFHPEIPVLIRGKGGGVGPQSGKEEAPRLRGFLK